MSVLSLARTLRQRTPTLQFQCRRWFAEVVNAPSEDSTGVPVTATPTKAVDWRKGRVPVREDHGLYGFFRRKEVKDGEVLEGDARFEVFETPQSTQIQSGRGWKAEELRLKSFKDLHVLWYVLVRERNLLATQKEEVRRMGVQNRQFQVNATRVYHVRKSMARIKQVINERRVAYEQAVGLIESERDTADNLQVLEYLKEERKVMNRKERRELKLRKAAKAKVAEEAAKAKATPKEIASQTAAAGLFGSAGH
ncbi:MRP-L47-domain-containing protein [Macrolepiota fuliginosa MF-IS2]|uniref:Large ribosomal subunit protein uL29m n=1 Tax=Macrolepiota fuliginosa MF-IS2 TaxID=1400762 RepID=A0A9P5XNN8_9AGAR|nr:MRP-L47-domain-containing protein [Macrolepiota fuliginosa MF-IS2]